MLATVAWCASAAAQRRPVVAPRVVGRPAVACAPLGRAATTVGTRTRFVSAERVGPADSGEPIPSPEELQSAIERTQDGLGARFGTQVLVLSGYSTPAERRELGRGLVALRNVIDGLRHPRLATRPGAIHLINLRREDMQADSADATENVTLDLRADPRSWGELLSLRPDEEPVVREFREVVAARDLARPAVMARVERALREGARTGRPPAEVLRAAGVPVRSVSERQIPGGPETSVVLDDPDVEEIRVASMGANVGVQMIRGGRAVRTFGMRQDGSILARATPHYEGDLRSHTVTEDAYGNERVVQVQNPRIVPRADIVRQRLVRDDALFERLAIRLGRTEDAIVGVVDTGVDYNHPALAHSLDTRGRPAPLAYGGTPTVDNPVGWDFVDNDPRPFDPPPGVFVQLGPGGNGSSAYHGTGVTGVAVQGTSRVRAVVCRAGDECSIARSFEYLRARGVRIVNLSQGARDPMPRVSAEISQSPDTIYVMGAGNDHGHSYEQSPFHPQQEEHPNAIVVGAHDEHGAMAELSTSDARRVHVAAPGVNVLVPRINGESERTSGTSFAAPFVANLAAKIRVLAPHLTSAGVREIILRTVDRDPAIRAHVLHGRVNPARALHLAYVIARTHDAVPIGRALREIRETQRSLRAERVSTP